MILSALFVAAAFAPVRLWAAAIVGYFLFFRSLRNSSHPVRDSFLFGLVFNAIILIWSDTYVGVPPYLLLVVIQALFSLPLGVWFGRYRSIRWLPLILLLSEYARERIPFGGFGWSNVGYSQVNSPYVHLASVGGVWLLTAFVAMVAAVERKAQVFLILLLIVVGLVIRNPIGHGSLTVAAVQGTSPERTSFAYTDAIEVFHRHLQLSKSARPVDVIVWPEDVVDGSVQSPSFTQGLEALKNQNLIVGQTPFRSGQLLNASTLITRGGEVGSTYVKRSLVPFGEYILARPLVSKLNSHAKEVLDFHPGRTTVTHRVNGIDLAPIICFEIIDGSVVRDAAQRSRAILAQTNSATFVGTYESQQQFDITRIRAIEYSRPILSVSTMGITAFIDNNGQVIAEAPQNQPRVLYGTMIPNAHKTIYAAFPWMSLIVVLVFGAMGRRYR